MTKHRGNRKMGGSERAKIIRLRDAARFRQRNSCYYCKCQMTSPITNRGDACTAEHVIPIRDGGRSTYENIVAACAQCNQERSVEQPRQEPARATLGDVFPCPA